MTPAEEVRKVIERRQTFARSVRRQYVPDSTTQSALIEALEADVALLSTLLAERDEALGRADELEGYQEQISTKFEKDCWVAMRSILDQCKFDWSGDPVTAEDARKYISETLCDIERREAAAITRAEAQRDEAYRQGYEDGERSATEFPREGN